LETQDESIFAEKNKRTTDYESHSRVGNNPIGFETVLSNDLCDKDGGQIFIDSYWRQYTEKTNISHSFYNTKGEMFFANSEPDLYRKLQCSVYPNV
jgi:hypothetical protein